MATLFLLLTVTLAWAMFFVGLYYLLYTPNRLAARAAVEMEKIAEDKDD